MKRFVWLLLFAFCSALAQVQPVDMTANAGQCDCCDDGTGACDMPDCGLPPGPAQTVSVLPASAPALRIAARKIAPAPRVAREPFFVQFVSRPALTPAIVAAVSTVPAASVPLFKAHCSFLI